MFNLEVNKKLQQTLESEINSSFPLKTVVAALFAVIISFGSFSFDIYQDIDRRLDLISQELAVVSQENKNQTDRKLLDSFREKIILIEKRINFLEENANQ